jgi:hypothetical protein
MENMENVVMNEGAMGDVMSTEATIGGKIGKGLLVAGVVAGVGLLVRKGVRKIKSIRQAKKAAKEDIIDAEYTEEVTDGN